jgi:acetolactate synthase-1/2/3 large subunit
MKLSDYIVDFFVSRGVSHIFEVCGGSITHLLDSMYGRRDIACVSMHHEQAAAFAAEGYARVSGKPGVAMATSGPGATNLITGIGSCYFDSVPCLFLTGQVNTYEFKFDRPVRQIGFQETDIVKIVKPIVKYSRLVRDGGDIRRELEKSFYLATQGRPGPVLLDLPMDVQRSEVFPGSLKPFVAEGMPPAPDAAAVDMAAHLLGSSARPMILAGGGVRISGATGELYDLATSAGIPVVASLMGLDAFPHDEALYSGMIGTYGNRYANLAIANADVVLALGTRLDTRQTGTRPGTFARDARLIHVDIDPSELNGRVAADLAIHSDIKAFLQALNARAGHDRFGAWRHIVNGYKSRYPSYRPPAGDLIQPNHFLHELSGALPEDAVVCADVGQNQMWAAQSLILKKGQRFLTQGGMAAMGCALPIAIGASFAMPGRGVFVITGDGGFQLNLQELQTVVHHGLPIKIIMLNNGCYGMVRQFQEQYFSGRLQSTVVGYSAPDFTKVMGAYGIPSLRIKNRSEIGHALSRLAAEPGPMFLEAMVPRDSIVTPKLGVDRPVEEQDPQLPHEELKQNMVIKILSESSHERRKS